MKIFPCLVRLPETTRRYQVHLILPLSLRMALFMPPRREVVTLADFLVPREVTPVRGLTQLIQGPFQHRSEKAQVRMTDYRGDGVTPMDTRNKDFSSDSYWLKTSPLTFRAFVHYPLPHRAPSNSSYPPFHSRTPCTLPAPSSTVQTQQAIERLHPYQQRLSLHPV